jgi:hypothetical protein
VNESPSIKIRGRGSVSGTCLTFSSRKPWLFTFSEYLSRPQARVVEQYGCNASTRQGSRPRHPKSSAGVGTDERREKWLYTPSSATKTIAQKKTANRSNSSFCPRLGACELAAGAASLESA